MARACAEADIELQLPFSGSGYLVLQGNDGAFSHRGNHRFAWDFRMPEGSEVRAAADGVVVEVIDWNTVGGNDRALAEKANFIYVDHGRARYSVYQHLRFRGSLVKAGQTVSKGQLIGYSGNTGFSTEPHLHFALIDYRNRTLPVCLADVPGGVPRQGYVYRGTTQEAKVRSELASSVMPSNAFSENGVEITSPAPARHIRQPFVLSGRALRAGSQVSAVFYARERNRSPKEFRVVLRADRTFQIAVDPRELSHLGFGLDLAVSLIQPGRPAVSGFTVPMFLDPAGVSGGQ